MKNEITKQPLDLSNLRDNPKAFDITELKGFNVRPDESTGGWDIEIYYQGERLGAVTLVNDWQGHPAAWGSLDNWANKEIVKIHRTIELQGCDGGVFLTWCVIAARHAIDQVRSQYIRDVSWR